MERKICVKRNSNNSNELVLDKVTYHNMTRVWYDFKQKKATCALYFDNEGDESGIPSDSEVDSIVREFQNRHNKRSGL